MSQSRPDRFRRSNSNDDDSLPHRGPSRRSGSADDDRGSSSGRPASSRRRVNHDDRPDSRHGSSSANYSSNNASSNNNSSSQIRPSGVRMTAAQRRLAMAEKARSNGVPSSSSASSLQKRNVSPPRMASSVNTSLQRLERAGRENAYTESEAETFLQRAQGSLDMASRATGNFLARVRGRVPTPQPSRPLALPPPSKSEASAAAPAPTPPRQFSGRYGGGLPPEVNRSGVATSRRASTEEADDSTVAETEVSFATMTAAAALAAAATTGQVQEPSSSSYGRRSPARDVVPSRARSREDQGRGRGGERGGEGSGASGGDGHGNPQTPPPRANPGMLLSHASDNDLYTAYGEPLSRRSSNGSSYHVGAARVLPPGVASSPIVGPASSTGQGPHKLSGDEVEFDLANDDELIPPSASPAMEIADPNLSLRRRRKGASNRSTSGSSRSPVPLEGSRSDEDGAGGSRHRDEGSNGQLQASTPPPPFHLPPAASNLPQPPPPSSSFARVHGSHSSSQNVPSFSSSSPSSSQQQQLQPPASPPKPVRVPPPSNGPPSPKPPRNAPQPPSKAPVEAAATPTTPVAVRSSVAQWSGIGSEDNANNCWSEAPSNVFQVRGPKYLSDKKKMASAPCLYATVGLDVLFNNENAAPNKSKGKSKGPPRLVDRADSFLAKHVASGNARFVIALNFLMPWGSFVTYLAPRSTDSHSPHGGDPRVDPMLVKLATGDEAYCRARLKLVPHVVKGSWSIKKMVGNKPAIIGKVLKACHAQADGPQGANWLEIQLDSATNRAARYLIGAASNKGVVMDMGVVLQADTSAELPERILGGLRVHRLAGLSSSDSFMEATNGDSSDAPDDQCTPAPSSSSSTVAGGANRGGGSPRHYGRNAHGTTAGRPRLGSEDDDEGNPDEADEEADDDDDGGGGRSGRSGGGGGGFAPRRFNDRGGGLAACGLGSEDDGDPGSALSSFDYGAAKGGNGGGFGFGSGRNKAPLVEYETEEI